jgi:hypothetical protein
MMVFSTGIRPRLELAPAFQRLELHRMGGDVGNIEIGQQIFGGLGVVIGGAADQREAGERQQRIDP